MNNVVSAWVGAWVSAWSIFEFEGNQQLKLSWAFRYYECYIVIEVIEVDELDEGNIWVHTVRNRAEFLA